MFKDYIQIRIKAGNGGDGARSFRREKYIPAGGPDGGDGGDGGDIIFVANSKINTLSNFDYNKLYKAEDGKNGGTNQKTGARGEDLIIEVPVGTVVYEQGKIVADLKKDGVKVYLLKGGKGGFGNMRFKSSTKQAPNFSVGGEKTDERTIVLELQMIADVGLVGFPNAGKSTFLSVVTNAKPKIANYPFTTIIPNLGVVEGYGEKFVIADIPGLIEGASSNIGLGHKFLKHISRTKLLLFLIDVTDMENNPENQLEALLNELKIYSEKYNNNIIDKEKVVVITKIDAAENDVVNEFKNKCLKKKFSVFEISSVSKKGIKELLYFVSDKVKQIKEKEIIDEKSKTFSDDSNKEILTLDNIDSNGYRLEKAKEDTFEITKVFEEERKRKGLLKGSVKEEDLKYNKFIITGKGIERIMGRVNLSDGESISYLQNMLERIGVTAELKKQDIKEGDVVDLLGFEFEWTE